MTKKPKDLFDMYEDVKESDEKSLTLDRPSNPGEGSERVQDEPDELRTKGYTIEREFDVPDGEYMVRVVCRTKAGPEGVCGWWLLEAQGDQKYVTPDRLGDWREYDSGWLSGVETSGGTLRLTFRMGWFVSGDSAYLDWVEFRYEKVG